MGETEQPAFRRAVVALNGGSSDERIVRLAASMAARGKAELIAVHVVEIDWTLPLDADIAGRSEEVQRVLDSAEATAEDFKLQMEPVLLQRFLPDLCREQSHERGREIGSEIDATLPPVLADEGYLRQVLQNLLSNADKYSPQGKPVDVSAEREGLVVRVIVADRGPGIAREHLDAIFEPFVRMQGGTAVPGAGLGLAVCQRLVEAMGGRMNLRPRPGGGSEFSFTVPVLGDEFGEPEQREQAPAASEARPRAGLASD